jgi:NAD(P)H-nitrite reductase large subunit
MDNKIICYCMNVSRNTIVEAIKNGANNLKDIQKATTACTGNKCKELNTTGECCSKDILEIIKQETGVKPESNCHCCH